MTKVCEVFVKACDFDYSVPARKELHDKRTAIDSALERCRICEGQFRTGAYMCVPSC
jgi:hypothetical protein